MTINLQPISFVVLCTSIGYLSGGFQGTVVGLATWAGITFVIGFMK